MTKAVVFLGIGYLQIEAIRAASKMGFYTIGFDLKPDADGKDLVDEFFNISGINCAAILHVVFQKNIDIRFIWANNDIFIETRCMLEEYYNVEHPRVGLGIARKILDKVACKKSFSSDLSIPIINQKNVSSYESFITKPANGSGSYGVRLVDKVKAVELIETGHVVEPYIRGEEFGLNCFVGKNITWFESVKRYFNRNNDFVPRGTVLLSPAFEPEGLLKAKIKLEKFIKDSDLKGPLKFDLIITNSGEPFIIEFSPRFHGEIDTSLVLKIAKKPSIAERFFRLASGQVDYGKLIADEKKYYGYISVFRRISIEKAKKIVADFSCKIGYELSIVDFFDVSGSVSVEDGELSTASIKQYFFYAASKQISDIDFIILSDELNNV